MRINQRIVLAEQERSFILTVATKQIILLQLTRLRVQDCRTKGVMIKNCPIDQSPHRSVLLRDRTIYSNSHHQSACQSRKLLADQTPAEL